MAPIYIKFVIAKITKWARAPVPSQTDLGQNSSSSAFDLCDPEELAGPFWALVFYLLKVDNDLHLIRLFLGLNEITSVRHLYTRNNTSRGSVGIISIFYYLN